MVHNYGNIECRDAVLAWDAQELAYDDAGQLLSRWDGRTYKTHPVTGEQVPDEAAQVPQWRYVGRTPGHLAASRFHCGQPAVYWKQTDARMRWAHGYVQALRGAWPEVPEAPISSCTGGTTPPRKWLQANAAHGAHHHPTSDHGVQLLCWRQAA